MHLRFLGFITVTEDFFILIVFRLFVIFLHYYSKHPQDCAMMYLSHSIIETRKNKQAGIIIRS